MPRHVQTDYDLLLHGLTERFDDKIPEQAAYSLLLQLRQLEGESSEEFAERIREMAHQATSPDGAEPCPSLLVNVFLQGCRDQYAALQALHVNHTSLEQALAFVKMYSSHKEVIFGKSKVRRVKFEDLGVGHTLSLEVEESPLVRRMRQFSWNKSVSDSFCCKH